MNHLDRQSPTVHWLAIQLGLDELFGGNRVAAQEWLDTPREELGGSTPWQHVVKAMVRVNSLLADERNLR